MSEETEALAASVMGLDASRRVGWAKFYDEADAHALARRHAIHWLGVMLETAFKAAELGVAKQDLEALGLVIAEHLVHDDDERFVFQEGRFAAGVLIKERWGTWTKAFKRVGQERVPTDPKFHSRGKIKEPGKLVYRERDKFTDYRCGNCHRSLFHLKDGLLEIKCSRCGSVRFVKTGPVEESGDE